MPTTTKIKYPEIEVCEKGKEECLCVTCGLLGADGNGNHTQECDRKRCVINFEDCQRICKGNIIQCDSYINQKGLGSNRAMFELYAIMYPDKKWMKI